MKMKNALATSDIKYLIKYKLLRHLKRALDEGGDVNAIDSDGRTPLIVAVIEQNIDVVRDVLMYEPDQLLTDRFGKTAENYATDLSNGLILAMLQGAAVCTN